MRKMFEYGFAALVALLVTCAVLFGAAIVEATLVVAFIGVFGIGAAAMCSTKEAAPNDWRSAPARDQVFPDWSVKHALMQNQSADSSQMLELANRPYSLYAAEQRYVAQLDSF
jgi:hypothetical protein